MKLSDENNIKFAKIKLTLQYTLITLVVLVLLITSFYLTFSNFAYKDFDSTLQNRAISIATTLSGKEESAIEDLKSIAGILKNYDLGNESIMIFDSKGNILYENTQDKFVMPTNVKDGFYTLEGIEGDEQKTVRAYITKLNNTNYYLLVARNYDDLRSSLNEVLISFLLVVPFILLIIIFLSYRFASSAIRPIEESMRILKQFTGDASHELKTPISTIKANIEVALMKERTSDYYKEKLATILDSVNRMSKLIQDMLFISRLDMETYPVKVEEVSLKELLEKIKSQFEGLALSKSVNLIIDADRHITIKTDKDILFEIISTFVENGIEYNKINGFVKIYVDKVENNVKIIVEDSGIGIKESDIPYIFDRFYRGEKSRSRETGGVGLGLSIAKELASLIGAKIEVESKVNMGSKFTLILKEE
ncbi:sensor histidine kinase [Caldisericum exile]|uniref:histidine kinase n=1 Tax=Caldisericum exile (strain DSM 21853 / NBRC 104410 / AZM16c01) TaxID=511051 RepID=A0A7U6JEB3_CALEA|nr:HAMP domain-containing sensor histidine kinase [Caldisericum exile]BAL80268.1 two-component system sensor histidine kinase [Caldisericum exile AZM16c01]